MARKNLLKTFHPADQETARALDNIRDAFEVVTADHDVLSSPATYLVASGAISPGASVVVYKGGASRVLTLPAASALGSNTAAIVLVVNTSASPVTVAPSNGNTLNGATSLSLAAMSAAVLVSDGATAWTSVTTTSLAGLAAIATSGSGADLVANSVSNAKLAQAPANTLKGNPTGGTANETDVTLAADLSFNAGALQLAAFTGDVTKAAGATATTIAANAVTNAKAAQMATLTIKGNNTGGTANALDLTVAQMQAMVTYPGRLRSFQVLSAGTTYTRPAGITSILVEGWAGGGGGGGTAAAAAGQAAVGAGGGQGGYFRKWYLVAPATGTCAIGGAGTAGASTGAVAGNGGNTTFTDGTTLCTAFGGAGCPVQALTGAATGGFAIGGAGGAVSTNGDVNLGGESGGVAMRAANAGTANDAVSGAGGGMGGGAPLQVSGAGNSAGSLSGAGGGGALALSGAIAAVGGAGGAGRIVVWEFA